MVEPAVNPAAGRRRGRSDAQAGLAKRSGRAGAWQLAANTLQSILTLVVLGLLSRLLGPREFGVLALAMIFVNFAVLLSDTGMTAAIVQRAQLSVGHIRVAFTTSVLAGAGLVVLVLGTAGYIAEFFKTPELAPVLRLLSTAFFVISLGQVASALLWRDLRFRENAIATIAGVIGYGTISIWLALLGYGIWSLAWGTVAQYTIATILMYAMTRHSVRPYLGRTELNEVLSYGIGMSLTKIFNLLSSKADYMVVGRVLGAVTLGLYERSFRLMEVPSNYIAGVVNRVAFPVMAGIQEDRDRLTRIYLHGVNLTAMVYVPMAVLFWFGAPHIIGIVFGPKWHAAEIPFRILSLGVVLRASNKVTDSLTRAVGAVYRTAWRIALYLGAVVLCAWAGCYWGLVGASWGGLVALSVRWLLASKLSLDILDLSWRRYLSSLLPGLVIGAAVTGALLLIETLTSVPSFRPVPGFAIQALLTALVCIAGPFLLPAKWLGPEFFDLLKVAQRSMPFRIPVLNSLLRRERAATV